MDLHSVYPVVQVLAKSALPRRHGQVLIRSGYHAHVHRHFPGASQGGDSPFLQHPQEAGLGRLRHVADLVQEQGPAISLLKPPLCRLPRVGEGPARMPIQLGLRQGLGQGRAVHRHQRARGPQALEVYGPGHQLLARSRFSGDQHRCGVGLRHLLDFSSHLNDRGTVTDHGGQAVGLSAVRTHPLQSLPVSLLLSAHRMESLSACEGGTQALQIDGLGEKVGGPLPQGPHRGLHVPIPGGDHHFCLRRSLPHLA